MTYDSERPCQRLNKPPPKRNKKHIVTSTNSSETCSDAWFPTTVQVVSILVFPSEKSETDPFDDFPSRLDLQGLKLAESVCKFKWTLRLPKVLDVLVMVVEEVLVPLELVLVALADANTARSFMQIIVQVLFFIEWLLQVPSCLFNVLFWNDCSNFQMWEWLLWNALNCSEMIDMFQTWSAISIKTNILKIDQHLILSYIVNIWLFEGCLTFLAIRILCGATWTT